MAVTALSIRWLGLAVEDRGAAVRFFRETLGMSVVFDEEATTELETSDGDRVQLFSPGHAYHGKARGWLPLFEVSDARRAQAELSAAGVDVGPIERDDTWEWFDVPGPEGLVVELASRR